MIELVIVLLFFSLSMSIILQLFVAAYEKKIDNILCNTATIMAEDILERASASTLAIDDFFIEEGWMYEEGRYVQDAEIDGRAVRLTASGAREATTGGMLDNYLLTVQYGDREIITLPIVRYLPDGMLDDFLLSLTYRDRDINYLPIVWYRFVEVAQ